MTEQMIEANGVELCTEAFPGHARDGDSGAVGAFRAKVTATQRNPNRSRAQADRSRTGSPAARKGGQSGPLSSAGSKSMLAGGSRLKSVYRTHVGLVRK
jgi:hypothetical protein